MKKSAGKVLPRDFYARDAATVAKDLLGKILIKGDTAGIIIETEAYPGGDDLASHSAAGLTNRTRAIFGPPGHAYVYFCYGMHTCMNIVASPDGVAGCVLIRALEPVQGHELMRNRRTRAKTDKDLASGPAKLTQAMGITLDDYGVDLTHGEFIVRYPVAPVEMEIDVTPRIGISKCADLPLRFVARLR